MNTSLDRNSTHTSYEAELPAELESAVVSRRLLAAAVKAWGLPEGTYHDGALALSELVTNSVLHAGTSVRVRIEQLGTGLRLEVEDDDPNLPRVEECRPEDLLANRSMTGRGLALIAAMSDRWGCEARRAGKVTWAEVGTGRRKAFPAGAAAAPSRSPATVDGAPPDGAARRVVGLSFVARGGRMVHLLGVPVDLLLESTRQLSDLQREVQVMAMGRCAPPELEQVVQSGEPWINDIDQWTDSDRRLAEWAAASGAETVDFDVFVPDDVALRIEGIAGWLRRAASSLFRKHLLTLPASAEVTAYRRWYAEEILRQLSGWEPRPCPLGLNAARGS